MSNAKMSRLPLLFALACGFGLMPPAASADTPTTTSYHLLHKYPLGGDGGWDYLNLDPEARRLYISRATHVVVVDADTGVVVGDVPNTNGVHGIALAPDLGRGFTSNGRENTVTIFDLNTLKELGRVKTDAKPDAVIYDPATKRVFAFNGDGKDATVIDAATGAVAGTIPLDGQPEYAVPDGQGTVFVNLEDKSETLALDAQRLTVKGRWPLAPGESPSGIALDRAHRRLFVTCRNQKLIVLNADTGAVVATPAIGNGPDAANFDPATGLAFSSNGKDGTLTVLHEDTPDTYSVAQTLVTLPGARTHTLDVKTHHLFLVTATQIPTPPGAPRQFVPGSFVVLEYGPSGQKVSRR